MVRFFKVEMCSFACAVLICMFFVLNVTCVVKRKVVSSFLFLRLHNLLNATADINLIHFAFAELLFITQGCISKATRMCMMFSH